MISNVKILPDIAGAVNLSRIYCKLPVYFTEAHYCGQQIQSRCIAKNTCQPGRYGRIGFPYVKTETI